MAVFRVERNTGYTVMSNHHLRNKELSLKAKGLLSQMLSLPEDWDYGLRDYGLDAQIGREDTPEQYIGRLVEVFRELRRVLKDDGTFWLNIADTYCGSGMKAGCKQKDLIGIPWLLAFALRSDGWYLRSDIIWLKENPMPESCRDRPSRCYEHIAELQKEQVQDAPREKAAMPEYIYKIEANPRTTGDNDRFFLQAYLPQENGRAKIGDVLYIGSLAKCRELMGGLNAGELTQGEVKELYAKAQEAEADKDTFSIYQLKQGDETRDFRFEPYNRLQAAGNVVDKANYELVYSAELTPGTSLEDIYTRFNIDHPKDFKGHSLSVSDVVVLHQNGQDAAHYVDSFGYKEVPEFLQEQTQQPEKINPLKHVEDTIEQNDNNFDGIINNTPTVDELEAKVKAGEQISLVDLAEAIKADKERGKEKPSIRAQLTLAGIGASLGLSMNFEAVTARYVDVRLERKKEVLDAYHGAVEKAAPAQAKEAGAKKEKGTTKKKHKEMEL